MTSPLPPGYRFALTTPGVADYQRLRREAGLSAFDDAAAARGLDDLFLAVVIEHRGETVGMGRVIGDGGLFLQLVDIAVQPAHQGKGLGKAIVGALVEALADRLDAPAYCSLVADGEARNLYAQFGFAPVMPKSIGMARWIGPQSSPA
ncbi:MAG: GNAT family N-acetyltransferase [Gemmatimonadetes bacterium]|nr:GNAT family N-acetyltransferase [Gemmatimonadota bacterium]